MQTSYKKSFGHPSTFPNKSLIDDTNRMLVKCNKIKQISLSWINRRSKRVEIRVRHFIDFFNCFFFFLFLHQTSFELEFVCEKGYCNRPFRKERNSLTLDECFLISRKKKTKNNNISSGESNFNQDCFLNERKIESETYLCSDSASTNLSLGFHSQIFLPPFLWNSCKAHVTCGPILSNRCS